MDSDTFKHLQKKIPVHILAISTPDIPKAPLKLTMPSLSVTAKAVINLLSMISSASAAVLSDLILRGSFPREHIRSDRPWPGWSDTWLS